MTEQEFDTVLDEIMKAMETLHNHLLRIETWMKRQQEQQNETRRKIIRTR